MVTYLPGTYNVYNILSALSVAVQIWLDIEQAISSLQWFRWVSGRMERVEKDWINYFVDFAHSPDALEKTLTFLQDIKKDGKLIVVWWAPGNRDKLKRPDMWTIVYNYADVMIATDDDPDTENRVKIIDQLTEKIRDQDWTIKQVLIVPERYLAIKLATDIARPWDIVMFAGKWHETVQLTNFWKRKWNDKDVLLDIIK
jgi:UDP-N-acetylmuramyl tripeptide synthase